MSASLTIHNVSVAFHGHTVVHNISTFFSEKGISVLLGRSGSGKTTFLRSINRLNEEFPECTTTGQIIILINGQSYAVYPELNSGKRAYGFSGENGEVCSLPLTALRRSIGMVFQSPNVLPVSIYRNIAMPLELVAGCPRNELEPRIQKAFELVGLWNEVGHRLDMPAVSLSGGQQQRLCLARTLALEPAILLLDEPTASLDVRSSEVIEELLIELGKKIPIILVSHSLEQANRIGDRWLFMENGSICHDTADFTTFFDKGTFKFFL